VPETFTGPTIDHFPHESQKERALAQAAGEETSTPAQFLITFG